MSDWDDDLFGDDDTLEDDDFDEDDEDDFDEDEEFENPAFIKWETAEDDVIGWETAYRIDSALEDRSKEDRIIFNMDREGYTAPEIAAQLGIKTSNVYVRLHRTKQAVSRSLVA